MELATERLLLRPVVPGDEIDMYRYSSKKDVGPAAGWAPHSSIEETCEMMRRFFLNQNGVFAMVQGGHVIGTIGLIEDPKRENVRVRMLGYALDSALWGRGYMTEAARAVCAYGFETLKLSLISAYTYPENVRSQRVLEKCGFQCEGRLRRCEKRFDGVVFDNDCYSLLPPDERE